MAGKWRYLPFDEAVEINPPVPLKPGHVYPFVDMQAIEPHSRTVRPNEYREFKGSGSRFADGDTLMARITPCLENGKIARFYSDDQYTVGHGSTEFIVIRGRAGVTDNDFAYYLTCWDYVRQYAISQMTGTSGRQRVPISAFSHLEVPIPPLSEQRAIARILGTLDDKIELLRRMNETLEAMALALFKSWFVDFDPVIDNALEAGNPIPDELKEKAKRRLALGERRKPLPEHIRRLFPGRFVDSELGPIPDGWRMGTVAELVSLSRELINPRDFPDEVFDHYSIPAFDAGKMPISEPGCAIKSNKLLVPRDAVLLSKLNPRFPRVWMPAVSWSRRSICSTEFLVALPKNGSSRDFIFCLFTEAGFLARFSSLVTGTSGSHQRVKPDSFLAMQIIIPPNDVVESFTRFVRPSFEQSFRNLAQSRTLAALRDALLPKLISGEMRVKDAKGFLEEKSPWGIP